MTDRGWSVEQERTGHVRVSPGVLATVAALAATNVPGVVRVASRWPRWLQKIGTRWGQSLTGVRVRQEGDAVHVEVSLVVASGTNILEVAAQVQRAVANAITGASGIVVRHVDVQIRDVE